MFTYHGVSVRLAKCLNSVLNVKAVVAAFNQEKALVGAFSVITNLRMELFEALAATHCSWLATNELWTTAVAEWRVREVLGRRGDTAACAGIIIQRLYIYTSDCQTAGGLWMEIRPRTD